MVKIKNTTKANIGRIFNLKGVALERRHEQIMFLLGDTISDAELKSPDEFALHVKTIWHLAMNEPKRVYTRTRHGLNLRDVVKLQKAAENKKYNFLNNWIEVEEQGDNSYSVKFSYTLIQDQA